MPKFYEAYRKQVHSYPDLFQRNHASLAQSVEHSAVKVPFILLEPKGRRIETAMERFVPFCALVTPLTLLGHLNLFKCTNTPKPVIVISLQN